MLGAVGPGRSRRDEEGGMAVLRCVALCCAGMKYFWQ